ncbi:MAG: DNA gyrase/topoisomerase IV subunit A [Oligoflexales bacterium]|nr:DNA gyrase/topoisomerase IV subunit A [Oligoflexales bacterium]
MDQDLKNEKTEQEAEQKRQGATGGNGLDNLYKDWFLDYASYVILDRAIPSLEDGLKPVQRRILHSLNDLEDGRYNKAANVIGHSMRYHPHGDMAISDAMVKLAQKDLLIDTQGNWGSLTTGDRAAAARYIEARLSGFAKEVVFNPETTWWQRSYDGRNDEPVFLPVKFPLLLAQGAEGIAVGLSTKILPHNFCELLKESIAILKGYRPQILPDFPTGGIADFSDYKEGKKGSKVKVRAVIETINQKTLCIREVPFGVTTSGLIDSILAAMEKGQIKVKKLQDNTAQDVEILIHLPAGSTPEKLINALYAFTDCEVSISPNCCVISDGKPIFCSVNDVLKSTAENTKSLLEKELKISEQKLKQKIHAGILEQIFIEEKIYRKIESASSFDEVLKKIRRHLKPFSEEFFLELSERDIEKLTEIKIKKISKFEKEQSSEALEKLKSELKQVEHNLENLNKYAIAYFRDLLKKYGKGRERRTKIDSFNKLDVKSLVVNDQKLYVNRKDGFIGTGLKQDEFLFECSKLDEIIAICEDGSFKVVKVSAKSYIGKNIIWISKFVKNEEQKTYHIIYRNGKSGSAIAKRCSILSATKEKTYQLTKGTAESKILYLSVNPEGKSEVVSVNLKPSAPSKKKSHLFDFSSIEVKNRSAVGTVLTKYPVSKIVRHKLSLNKGSSQRVWFDRNTGKLNFDGNGVYLGKFGANEKLIGLFQSGTYEILNCQKERFFSEDLIELQKWEAKTIISAIYLDGGKNDLFVKRIAVTDDTLGCKSFVPKTKGTKLMLATLKAHPVIKADFAGEGSKTAPPSQLIKLEEFIDIKNIKSTGEKLSKFPVKKVKMVREKVKSSE